MTIEPSYLFWLLFSVWNTGYIALYNTMQDRGFFSSVWVYVVGVVLGPLYTLVALLRIQQLRTIKAQVIRVLDNMEKDT